MSTAQEIVDSAARWAGILAQGQVLESGVNADCMHALNLMLKRWRNNGVDLGLPTLITSTTVIVDDSDEEAIELQLALRLMTRFGRPIKGGLSAAANSAFVELQAKYIVLDQMTFESSLTSRRGYTR